MTTTLESLNSFSIVFMKKLLVKSAKDELASSDSALSQVYCNFVITEAEGSFINHVDKSIQNQNKHRTFYIFDKNVNKMFSKNAPKINENFTVNLTLVSCQIDSEDIINFCGLLGKQELYQCGPSKSGLVYERNFFFINTIHF